MIRSAVVVISRFCNLSCPFCLSNSGARVEEEISSKEIIKFFDKYRSTLKSIKITGGEPLSPPVFTKTIDVVKYAIKNEFSMQINTNGTFKPLELSDKIFEKVLFQVSLDGLKEDHDAIRGQGVFDKATSFIKERIDMGHKVKIMSVILNPIDFEKIDALGKFCKSEFGIGPNFQVMSQVGRGVNLSKPLANEFPDIISKIQSMGYNCRNFVSKCNSLAIENNIFPRIAIDSYGNIIPCPYLLKYKIGHISENISEAELKKRMTQIIGNATCCYPDGK